MPDKTVVSNMGGGLMTPSPNRGNVFARDMGGPPMPPGGGMGMDQPMEMPEAPSAEDIAPIFIEWAFGKAAQAQAEGNEQGAALISQGIQMVIQGLQGAEAGENVLPRQQIGDITSNLGAPPAPGPEAPFRSNRGPFGGGGVVPALP